MISLINPSRSFTLVSCAYPLKVQAPQSFMLMFLLNLMYASDFIESRNFQFLVLTNDFQFFDFSLDQPILFPSLTDPLYHISKYYILPIMSLLLHLINFPSQETSPFTQSYRKRISDSSLTCLLHLIQLPSVWL